MATHQDFSTAQLQLSAFTPGLQFQVNRVLAHLLTRCSDVFDGEPVIVPVPPVDGVQIGEIPRVILQSTDGRHRLQAGSSRFDLFWIRQDRADELQCDEEIKQAVQIILAYLEFVRARVGRLACLATRTLPDNAPALTLARHFCQERWLDGPLNRPGDFEIHAHKRFHLLPEIEINSWFRCKTGRLSAKEAQAEKPENPTVPVIVVEQDFNTLAEALETREFQPEEIQAFFAAAPAGLDEVLARYFPG